MLGDRNDSIANNFFFFFFLRELQTNNCVIIANNCVPVRNRLLKRSRLVASTIVLIMENIESS